MHDLSANIKFEKTTGGIPAGVLFLSALLTLAFVHALVVLWLGINKPLLDLYYFRQTQTARQLDGPEATNVRSDTFAQEQPIS